MTHFSQFCRKSLAVSVLVLALTCATFAGEMQYPVEPPPPPPPTSSATATTDDGHMQHPAASDSVTGFAANVLQSVLSLF